MVRREAESRPGMLYHWLRLFRLLSGLCSLGMLELLVLLNLLANLTTKAEFFRTFWVLEHLVLLLSDALLSFRQPRLLKCEARGCLFALLALPFELPLLLFALLSVLLVLHLPLSLPLSVRLIGLEVWFFLHFDLFTGWLGAARLELSLGCFGCKCTLFLLTLLVMLP